MNPEEQAALKAVRKKNLQSVDQVPSEPVVDVQQGTAPETTPPVEAVESQEPTPQEGETTQTEEKTQDNVPPSVEKTEVPEPTPQSWDEDNEVPPTVETPKFDFTRLGSALGNEVKTEEDALAKVTELKSKLKSYEDNAFGDVPDEFKEVIKISKTGDWKEYLASQLIDYSKLDPIVEFENDFLTRAEKNPRYFTDGRFDVDKAETALEQVPDAVRESEGYRILEAKAYNQQQRRNAIMQAEQAKVEKAEKTLTTACKNLNELLPFESYSIKFEPKHSSEIFTGIQNSKLTKKHLGVAYEDLLRSGADMQAVAATIAKAEYTEKMLKFKSGTSKAEATKEILSKTQNPQIKNTGSPVSPSEAQKKIKTPAEKLQEYMNRPFQGI